MNIDNISKARKSIKLGNKTSSPICIILMGLPGTGKSYLSHYLNEKHGFTLLSGENITHAIFGTEKCSGSQYAEAYSILNYLAKELIDSGYKIVIDGTNLKLAFREQMRHTINDAAQIIGIHLTIDDNIAFTRANSRGIDSSDPTKILSGCSKETFEGFKNQIEFPLPDENFLELRSDEKLLESVDNLFLSDMF